MSSYAPRAGSIFPLRCLRSLSNSECAGWQPDPGHHSPLHLWRGIPPDTFVTTDVSYSQRLQRWRNVFSVGGSKMTHRVSVLTGAEERTGGHTRGLGQSFAQWPSWPQRKHGPGLGQSAAKWPRSPQLPQIGSVQSRAQCPKSPQRRHWSQERASQRGGGAATCSAALLPVHS